MAFASRNPTRAMSAGLLSRSHLDDYRLIGSFPQKRIQWMPCRLNSTEIRVRYEIAQPYLKCQFSLMSTGHVTSIRFSTLKEEQYSRLGLERLTGFSPLKKPRKTERSSDRTTDVSSHVTWSNLISRIESLVPWLLSQREREKDRLFSSERERETKFFTQSYRLMMWNCTSTNYSHSSIEEISEHFT